MKRIHAILCAAVASLLFCGCGGGNVFTIDGVVDAPELDGKTVYLFNTSNSLSGSEGPADSATVAEGRFRFKGKVDGSWIGMIGNPESPYIVTVVVEPGKIVVHNDSIGGTPLNDNLYAFTLEEGQSDVNDELSMYLQMYYSAPTAEMRAEAERLYDSVDAVLTSRTFDHAMKLYTDNRDNILGAYAMEIVCGTNRLTYKQLEEIVENASDAVKNNIAVQERLSLLRAIDATSAGKHYTDIQGVDGKLIDLIDGKLALVDFWASWCGPCRAEIKDNLMPLWKKYQNKGLVVVGLNVWERGDAATRKAAHEKAMANLGITYPQLVDSTRTATDTYGVIGIPQIMLIGPDGTILARDLRGAAIEEAIINALGK